MKRLDKIFLFLSLVTFILLGIVSNQVFRVIKSEADDLVISQFIATTKSVARSVQNEVVAGNYMRAWRRAYLIVKDNPDVAFLLLNKEKQDLVNDIGFMMKFEEIAGQVDWKTTVVDKNVSYSVSPDGKHLQVDYQLIDGRGGVEASHSLRFLYNVAKVQQGIGKISYHYLLLVIVTIVIFLLFLFFIRQFFSRNFHAMTEGVRKVLQGEEDMTTEKNLGDYFEFRKFLASFRSDFEKVSKELSHKTEQEALVNLAGQVAHDIRSPLAALDTVISDVKQVPPEQRTIIVAATKRIRDIANNLLSKSRPGQTQNGDLKKEKHMLSALLETILAEKRAQYKNEPNLLFSCQFAKEEYGLFIDVQSVEFLRVLSNLINNSVEALDGKGQVKIETDHAVDGQVLISVLDNGKGIEQDDLENLIHKGFSKGKENGSGLGLYHAHQKVKEWGGDLFIESTSGVGTKVTLSLPKAEAPNWFLSSLNLGHGSEVIILDDDDSVHQLWKSVLSPWRTELKDLKFHHFYDCASFQSWYDKQNDLSKMTFLVDYEILGSNETGLEMIIKNKLQKKAVLVTSHYENEEIRAKCQQYNLSLLPKGLCMFVPVIPISERQANSHLSVLIDDDALIRKVWEIKAKEAGIELLTFSSIEDFEQANLSLSSDTEIYLDSDLGEGLKGEEYAQVLSEHGLENIILATGHDSESFQDHPYLSAVVGKEPPFL